MKEILFATTNPAKSKRFASGLEKNNIKILTLKDLNLDLNIEENGTTAIQNAQIKARTLYQITKKASMGMDDTLYLEGVPEDKQPGLFVRRVNGKTLTDNEMIDYYLKLVKTYGHNGILNAKWLYGLVVINENGEESTYTWEKNDIYMVDQASPIINPGYPLNSITKYKEINKYLSEATKEDKEKLTTNEDHVINFIIKTLK